MPHMAEGPEQLEVENQCPTVSHDDVSRKHNTDLQYTSGKSWNFIANFNPEDISYHHSLEDYQRLFLTHDERIPLSYLVPGYSNKIHIVCFRFYGMANRRIRSAEKPKVSEHAGKILDAEKNSD